MFRFRFQFLLAMLSGMAFALPACALTMEGVEIPEEARLGSPGPHLVLNGAGVRRQAIVKVYVSALYLPQKNDDPETILAREEPRRLTMHFLRDVTAAQFRKATTEALDETLTAAQRKPLEAQLARLHAFLEKLPDVKQGTLITIDYLPKLGTVFSLDGKRQQTIAGAAFNRALMRVWLGDKPRDPQLRDAMLGRL